MIISWTPTNSQILLVSFTLDSHIPVGFPQYHHEQTDDLAPLEPYKIVGDKSYWS